MVRRIAFLLCAAAALAAAAAPQRIISTSPAITEMLYALGLGDRVVGVTTFCHYPPEAMKKPKIGSYMNPNLEVMASLRPDLVVAEVSGVRHPEIPEALRLKLLEINDASLQGIFDSIRKIGAAAGVPDRAAALISKMQSDLNEIRRRVAPYPKRRMVFIVGRNPGRIENLVAAGHGVFLNDLIDIGGGQNIFRDSVAAYAKIGIEEMLGRNPEAIVDMGEMAVTVGVTDAQKRAVVELWSRYSTLAAVREHRVYAVAADIFVVPGPRVVEAARAFARMLHPEAGL